ncbi:peptidase domain-containing ABC transporter [Burkholderia contaminans]|uniref:peptidase domain-containing ABC transporter n=1 Tax=Burkholderia contaminans TaxID=488447 RepID=UPI0024164238|nr:peptidase domain-containing ABC transporter [Burkholderia contaminans]WFN15387.1 peptidase domain-containing ABC transporter [Burkholderia contaminans]
MNRQLQFGFRRSIDVQLQTEATECGLACISMIATFHGYDTDLPTLRRRFSPSLKGLTLVDLLKIGAALDLAGRAVRLEPEELHMLRLPCILHWDFRHFVVLERVGRDYAMLVDPALGARRMSLKELSLHFSGMALELVPTPAFQPRRERQEIGLLSMMGRASGVGRGLLKIFLLALALEVFTIVAPFYPEWVTDQAITTGDRHLLVILALGFGLVLVIHIATEAMRSWAVTTFSTLVNVQWLANVFRHLLNLPLDYFGKRHIGDIVSRFDSVNTIQQALTVGFVESVLDGLMSVGTIIIMIVYNARLSLISVIAVVLYAIVRACIYGALRMSNQKQIVFAARGKSLLMESVRGIQSVRLFGKAEDRLARWLNVIVSEKNADLRTRRLQLIASTSNHFIFGLEAILVTYFGALAVIDRSLSLGMLFAFLSYRGQFTARFTALIDKLYELRILRLHAVRLADIVLAKREPEEVMRAPDADEFVPTLEIRKLSYSYSKNGPKIIENFDLRVEAGEAVAIVGPSGQGKTTLLKLLAGLLIPHSGDIVVGGMPIRQMGLANYRSLIGVVMQEDRLFSGSIAENISFFDPTPDFAWITECAQMASVHADIRAMPMGYYTYIGDMGSALSAGQRQRVMLARALYRRPKILLLDEATSHLDVKNERAVNAAMRKLNITRIIVAHRPETIASADRVVELARAQETA